MMIQIFWKTKNHILQSLQMIIKASITIFWSPKPKLLTYKIDKGCSTILFTKFSPKKEGQTSLIWNSKTWFKAEVDILQKKWSRSDRDTKRENWESVKNKTLKIWSSNTTSSPRKLVMKSKNPETSLKKSLIFKKN